MKLKELIERLGGTVICCEEWLVRDVEYAFASDLMSDVLTVKCEKLVLITGLANIQTVRTAEMSDIQVIFFVRNKRVTDDMIRLAQENCIVLAEFPTSMFRISGLMHGLGIKAVY